MTSAKAVQYPHVHMTQTKSPRSYTFLHTSAPLIYMYIYIYIQSTHMYIYGSYMCVCNELDFVDYIFVNLADVK